MNKKLLKGLIIFTLVFTMILTIGLQTNAQALGYINKNNVSLIRLDISEVDGKVSLKGTTENEKIKILVIKDKLQRWYDVKLEEGSFNEDIWLTEGTGKYEIAIMVNKEDRKYTYGPKFTVNNVKTVNKYLVPTKHVESDDKEIIALAKEITQEKEKDIDKAKAIYDWVSKNIKYDYEKYNKHLNSNYDNEYGAVKTLEDKKGVCYDYSTLVAALGRAVGLESKVIKGQGITEGFRGLHAWNEIYISEEDRWIKLDTTFAATSGNNYFDNEDFDENHIKEDEY